jgi:stress-induced-phosphoprotein 1
VFLRVAPGCKCDQLLIKLLVTSACASRAAEKDADQCIALQPGFAKGYIRKAHVQFFVKDYEKALATYEKGLAHDANNAELKEGVWKCQQALQRFLSGAASEEEIKERQAKAMSDPEVQHIMTDPVMQQARHPLHSTRRCLSVQQKHQTTCRAYVLSHAACFC